MKILYVGDIMGPIGVTTVTKVLPGIVKKYQVDTVVAQAENVTAGKGISVEDFRFLQSIGVNFCSGGNWTLHLPEIHALLSDPDEPIVRPANYPLGTPGQRYKYLDTPKGKILFISLLGKIVGRDSEQSLDNPLQTIDKILAAEKATSRVATIVNFHGDYSSEKVVIGHYLDGRVTAVIGDHWHVPTADARVLDGGTAHITDVGMCGVLNSSLGVKLPVIISRWKTNTKTKNELETKGACQFNAVVISINEVNGLAQSIEQIQKVI